MVIIAKTADELFEWILDCMQNLECDAPSVKYEIVNANLVLTDPTKNLMCNCKRKMPMRYAIGELMWYNSRRPDWKSIEPFSKFWKGISDDGEHVNSNYGWCIHDKYTFDQWEFVKELLKRDKYSRQAVIHIKEPRDLIKQPSKDVNCTISLQFLIRDDKLDMIVTMRSNDLWLGLPYDLFNFTCMQIQMAMELGVGIGTYYHNAASLHLYERDVEKVYENTKLE